MVTSCHRVSEWQFGEQPKTILAIGHSTRSIWKRGRSNRRGWLAAGNSSLDLGALLRR